MANDNGIVNLVISWYLGCLHLLSEWVLKSHTCTTMQGLCTARDQTQGFVHAKQTCFSTDLHIWSLKTSQSVLQVYVASGIFNAYPSPLPTTNEVAPFLTYILLSHLQKSRMGTLRHCWEWAAPLTLSCKGLWESYLVPAALDW